MKTEVQLTSKQITVDDLKNTDHVGYINADFGNKGHIVSIDTNQFTAISVNQGKNHCNIYNEGVENSLKSKVKDILLGSSIDKIFVFDTRKELYQWLAED